MSHDTPDPNRPAHWFVTLMRRLEVDRAVFYAILQRGWQFLAGPVTFLLIATFFTKRRAGVLRHVLDDCGAASLL